MPRSKINRRCRRQPFFVWSFVFQEMEFKDLSSTRVLSKIRRSNAFAAAFDEVHRQLLLQTRFSRKQDKSKNFIVRFQFIFAGKVYFLKSYFPSQPELTKYTYIRQISTFDFIENEAPYLYSILLFYQVVRKVYSVS